MEENQLTTYLDLLKENKLFYGNLTERDFQFIDDLSKALDVKSMSSKYNLTVERIHNIVRRLERKISIDINKLVEYYINLRKKEIKLNARAIRIEEREKELSIEQSENVLKYPDEFYLPLEDLDLSARALNIIRMIGFENIASLCSITKRDFLRYRNSGKKSMKEIDDYINKFGFKWE